MPAQSQQQQKLFGLALSVKRGETPRSEASDDVLNIVDTMSEKEIEDFASTSHSGLPTKVEAQLRGVVREIMRERVISEAASRTAVEIGALTGMNKDAVQKFVDTHNLDIEKLFKYVKAGKLKERMDFVAAVVGNPGNKIQKMIISKFGIKESVNEAPTRRSSDFFEDNSYGNSLHKLFKGKFDGSKFDKWMLGIEKKFPNDIQFDRVLNFIGKAVGMNIRKYDNLPVHKFISDLKSEVEKLYKLHTESVNEVKKGSVVIPYAMDKYGEFIVDKVFKNKDGETSYTGKFKKNGEHREFILHSKDRIVKESVNEGVSPKDMEKIKGAVEAASSFMGIGSELKKTGLRYIFATSPMPVYIVQPTPNNKVAIVNKKYATKPDFVIGDTAVGVMESLKKVNELKKLSNGNFSIKKGYDTFADYEKKAKVGDTILKYDKRGGLIKTFVSGSELHQNAKKYLSKVHSIVGDKVNLSLFGKQGYATVPDYEKKEVGVLVLESVNESSYNFGKIEYTKKNMTPVDILNLAFAYAQTPTTKIIGNKHEYRVNAANDLAKLTGSVQLDAKTKGKEPALILVLLKNSLVTKDEYIKLFKALKEKQISVIKALKNSSPEMRGSGGAARAAAKDMRGEFDID